jgi:hypothetical protein
MLIDILDTEEIRRLADGIHALRFVQHLILEHRDLWMTIEIKGLGANVEAARAAIRRARVATSRMNESGGTLERTANEIAAVFEQHTSDLLREAQTLGNSPSESEMQSQSGEPKAITSAPPKPSNIASSEAKGTGGAATPIPLSAAATV